MYNIKNRAGRSSSTGIVMRSKGSKSYKVRHYNINYFARDTSIGFTANFTLVRFKNKLISLIFFGSGTVSYHQTTSSTRLFSLTRLFTYAEKREIRESKNSTKYDGDEGYRWHRIKEGRYVINSLPRNKPVSLLEKTPDMGIRYVRSPGTKATIIKMDTRIGGSIVILPSKVKKIFSIWGVGSIGPVETPAHKKFFNRNAGYFRRKGHKPLSRGVAQNPIDHPHGGRTKSVKYPRTPWGKTTKIK